MTTSTDAPATGRARSVPYSAPIDGLRGLALLAIVVYHSGLGWAPGAFLSVSTFFTLSGFLITALMLAEHERADTVSLKGFWSRRLRRLMPAALAAIACIVVAAAWIADSTQLARLRGDALASLAYVANWRFIAEGDAYGAGFDSPSPFTHFWTLAIEEQFYIVLPLVVVGVLAAARGSRRVLAGVLAALAAASLCWSMWLESHGASTDRLYFGTDVRAAELIAGALLAVWWMRRTRPLTERSRRALSVLSPLALLVMVVSWVTADLQDRIFYRGGLVAYSLLTLTVIVGCLDGSGVVARALRSRPLVWVGTVSYGAYLLHFPILIWLEQRTPWPAAVRLVVALPVVLVLAALSVRFLEAPVRSGAFLRTPGRAALAGVAAVAGTLVLIVGVTAVVDVEPPVDLDAVARWAELVEQTAAQGRSDAPRIGVYGDSSALMTSAGLSAYSREHPEELVTTPGFTALGCGLLTDGERIVRGESKPPDEECVGWEQRWADASAATPSDLAVLQLGPWEITDQRLEADGEILTIGEDPEMDDAIRDGLRRAIDVLLVDNGRVVLLSPPDVDVGRVDGRSPTVAFDESDPARMGRFRELLAEVAAEHPRVDVVQLDDWVAAQPDDRRLRPDGVHFTDRTTLEVAAWLGPRLVEVFREGTGRTTTQVPTG
ncbi:MAG: acyltransferase family protein [Microthrixaceae bacterium]